MSRSTLHALAVPALAATIALSGCGDGPTAPRAPIAANPTPAPRRTPVTTPTPGPSPSPSPTPSAPPVANTPPTVSVTSSGACHPLPSRPCTVSFNATASDPDGDAIRFGWDGCAHGNQPLAICTIAAPGVVTASVLVDDGQGGLARASGTALGTNAPPVVFLGRNGPNPAPSNTTFTLVAPQPDDPDGDEDPNRLCTRASVAVLSGPCQASLAGCGGVSDGFDVDVRTLQGPGTCVIEARVADLWGAVGTARLSFNVLP